MKKAIGELSPSKKLSKELALLVKAKRDLLKSYQTYLSYYLYEQWHVSQGKSVKGSSDLTFKLASIKALIQQLDDKYAKTFEKVDQIPEPEPQEVKLTKE